jgi:hypothetical protein
MTRTLALVLSLALASSGCAAVRAQGARVATTPDLRAADPVVMADYIRQLPLGSRVKVSLANGSTIRGTLMKADADPIVVQKRTRIPERPVEIALADVMAVELDAKKGGLGRSIAIGAATGAAATLGVLMILAAVFAD